VYFITICCNPRGPNQLAVPEVWETILSTIDHREKIGDMKCRLALAMPDHLHALMGFPGEKSMKSVVTAIKSWVAGKAGVDWQRDFFDHRLRSWESAREKANYIRMNPVRARLVERPEDWPFQR
jgi:REP element-mobilizing transposase RayT